MPDSEVCAYMAKKIKQVVKIEYEDGNSDATWERNNDTPLDYMHDGVTVADAYKTYDALLGRPDRSSQLRDDAKNPLKLIGAITTKLKKAGYKLMARQEGDGITIRVDNATPKDHDNIDTAIETALDKYKVQYTTEERFLGRQRNSNGYSSEHIIHLTLDESLLTERMWKKEVPAQLASNLRKALDEANTMGPCVDALNAVIDWMIDEYPDEEYELRDMKDDLEMFNRDAGFEDSFSEDDFDDDEITNEENFNYILSNFYDLCDNLELWIPTDIIGESLNESLDGVRSILNSLVKDGRVKGSDNLPKDFKFLSNSEKAGEVEYKGTKYAFAVVDGNVKVMTSAEAGDNWSETLYKESYKVVNEDLENKFTIYAKRTMESSVGSGIYTYALIVPAKDKEEAKEKFETYTKDEPVEIIGINPTTPDEIRKGIIEVKDTISEGLETQPNVGLAAIVNNLIKDEWEAVQGYNDAIVSFEAEGNSDNAQVLRDILNEENVHIGQLETLLKTIDSSADQIDTGRTEAEIQINTSSIATDTSIPVEINLENPVTENFEDEHLGKCEDKCKEDSSDDEDCKEDK